MEIELLLMLVWKNMNLLWRTVLKRWSLNQHTTKCWCEECKLMKNSTKWKRH